MSLFWLARSSMKGLKEVESNLTISVQNRVYSQIIISGFIDWTPRFRSVVQNNNNNKNKNFEEI